MIKEDIIYIGVNDKEIDLFEGQYDVPNGMAYNSYLILDEKIAILDSVEIKFKDEWLNNIKKVIKERKVDYLIVQHMEPDHSANIVSLIKEYPNVKIVSNEKSFLMMQNYFNNDFKENKIIVNEGDTLSLGKHTLKFMMAPFVHWPEVMVTYDEYSKVLFSADAFGKFGTLDVSDDWDCEARRYYFGIISKYGVQVQNLLKKISLLDIEGIYPLHGPILTKNIEYYINLYDIWSSYKYEEEGVVIAYTSVYGNTKEAVLKLKELLLEKGCKKVVVNDLARCDMHEAIEDAFRYNKLVLATTTYNADIFPFMKTFIHALIERNYQNRIVAFIENGSWGPLANKIMKDMFSKSKNITYLDTSVSIKSSLNERNKEELNKLCEELL
jgi:flavorubredoxin